MKAIMLKIVVTVLFSILIVLGLFLFTNRSIHKNNSFVRQFPPHPIVPVDTADVKYNSFYIAGATDEYIYLGNTTSSLLVTILTRDLKGSKQVWLNSPEIEKTKFWSLTIKVDSPYFYLTDGAVPRIFSGRIDEWQPKRNFYDSAYFVDIEPITPKSHAVRSLSASTGEYVLGKESQYLSSITLSNDLLEKQVDGRFCVDGMLHYNKTLNRLVYLYYYRNQFIVYDTNLNLDYRGKTIDTISRAQISIARISSKNGFTHSSPPLTVNRQSCTVGNLLLVSSGLMAKNEDQENFNASSVIDVYDLSKREYKFSFYIPGQNGKKMHDFYVKGNTLIVLTNQYVFTYEIARNYFFN
jgi:hypothetical protein